MLQLTINEKGGPSRTESFEKDEVTIGRVQGNDIILPKGNISKRHSRIVLKDGKLITVDLKLIVVLVAQAVKDEKSRQERSSTLVTRVQPE